MMNAATIQQKKIEIIRKLGYSGDMISVKDLHKTFNKLKKYRTLVSSNQARKFVKRVFSAAMIEMTPEAIDALIDEFPKLGTHGYTTEQFGFLFYSVLTKCKLPLTEDLITYVIPRNQIIMDQFQKYSRTPFIEEEHNKLLLKLWSLSYPDRPEPPIPAEEWKILGFQGTNPATDFRGSGVLGIECLLALVEYPEFFHFLLKSAEEHSMPFSAVGINVVGSIFDFLGWGMKSGKSPNTFKTLVTMLFDIHVEGTEENLLNLAKTVFSKLFILFFGTIEKIWTTRNSQYMDFPNVMAEATEDMENILKKNVNNHFMLDLYLKKQFKLEVPFKPYSTAFIIILEDNKLKKVRYTPDQELLSILKQLCKVRNIVYSKYQALDPAGMVITDVARPLITFCCHEIYFLPRSGDVKSKSVGIESLTIYLPQGFKAIPYDKDTILGPVVNKLIIQRELYTCVPFHMNGEEIPDPFQPLSVLGSTFLLRPGTEEQIEAWKAKLEKYRQCAPASPKPVKPSPQGTQQELPGSPKFATTLDDLDSSTASTASPNPATQKRSTYQQNKSLSTTEIAPEVRTKPSAHHHRAATPDHEKGRAKRDGFQKSISSHIPKHKKVIKEKHEAPDVPDGAEEAPGSHSSEEEKGPAESTPEKKKKKSASSSPSSNLVGKGGGGGGHKPFQIRGIRNSQPRVERRGHREEKEKGGSERGGAQRENSDKGPVERSATSAERKRSHSITATPPPKSKNIS